MGTGREEISRWLDKLYENSTLSHMIVVCDTWDYEDYPVYIKFGEDPNEYRPGAMQKIMECYSKKLPKEFQLNQVRAHNYD